MASQEKTAGTVRFDRPFLNALQKNPAAVLREHGIEATPQVLVAIAEMDFEPLYRIADAFAEAPAAKPTAGEPTLGAQPMIEPRKAEVSLVFP